jgi:hypothetical protein
MAMMSAGISVAVKAKLSVADRVLSSWLKYDMTVASQLSLS